MNDEDKKSSRGQRLPSEAGKKFKDAAITASGAAAGAGIVLGIVLGLRAAARAVRPKSHQENPGD